LSPIIPFSSQATQLLFQVFSDRYERASTLITTNLPFAQWTKVFGDASMTAALLDRVTHRRTILEFNWGEHSTDPEPEAQTARRGGQEET